MNILSNPLTNYCRQLLLIICMLGSAIYADGQAPADSLFEKVTIAVLKSRSPEDKVKDGQRQLFLYSLLGIDSGLKNLYYHYKDSTLGQMLEDTTIAGKALQKLKEESSTISRQAIVYAAIDEMISRKGIASPANVQLNEPETTNPQKPAEDMTQVWVIGGLVVLAILLFYLQRKGWFQKTFRKKGSTLYRSSKVEEDEDIDDRGEEKKPVKNDKNSTDSKKNLESYKSKIRQLEKQKGEWAKEKEKLETANNNLTIEKERLDKENNTLNTEKKQKIAETEKLNGSINELKNLYKDATNVKTQLEKDAEFIRNMTEQLRTRLPGDGQPFPEPDSSVQSWFLIREVVNGIRSQEFNILGTPNYCQWVLGKSADFPELNTNDQAGNAGIIGFCKSLKQMGVKKVAPDDSYLIVNNLKITQKIYDEI